MELKRLRGEAGLEQQDAAARIGRSQQHVDYLEGARNLPSAGDLELLLGLYEVPERVTFMRELLAAAKGGKEWWSGLDEVVLYRRTGDTAVMHEQLAHLLRMSERPRIDIQVLPLDAGSTWPSRVALSP